MRSAAERLYRASRVTVVTGAGVSAASGVPTFRGADGLWSNFRVEELATPEAFARDPRLVWEWYEWRRRLVAGCLPNRAHERTRKVPVIVVTSSQEEKDVQRAYECGANSFVSKSDSPEKTLQRLRLLPIYWLELNRLPDDSKDSRASSNSSARP